ncbi:hypothetical protein GCM10007269_19580 [Microbacterium murale]|uniref:Uncharacterized protein n=1 Tax=Microbacterium murale TaxID=1081040 RepID=A0ABQ1RQ90_9MICO|nr:hypothetical protein GCM10007269_19580 [Microbacterium murale]
MRLLAATYAGRMQDAAAFDQFAMQPKCPRCGTVLRDVKGGYVCVACNEAYALPSKESSSSR